MCAAEAAADQLAQNDRYFCVCKTCMNGVLQQLAVGGEKRTLLPCCPRKGCRATSVKLGKGAPLHHPADPHSHLVAHGIVVNSAGLFATSFTKPSGKKRSKGGGSNGPGGGRGGGKKQRAEGAAAAAQQQVGGGS
jgi:hypothetical protein